MGQIFRIESEAVLGVKPASQSAAIVRIPPQLSFEFDGHIEVEQERAQVFLRNVTRNFELEDDQRRTLHSAEWFVAASREDIDNHGAHLKSCCGACRSAIDAAIRQVAAAPVFLGTLRWLGPA